MYWESERTLGQLTSVFTIMPTGVSVPYNLKCTGPSITYPVSSAGFYGCSGDPR